MKNYKTTLAGLAIGVYTIMSDLPDFTSMSWKEIAIRASKALLIAALGVFAHDPPSKS